MGFKAGKVYARTCPHRHVGAYSLNRKEVNVMSKLQSEYDLLREYSRELEEELASLKTDRMSFIRMNERLKEMIVKCEIEVRELRYDTEPPPR